MPVLNAEALRMSRMVDRVDSLLPNLQMLAGLAPTLSQVGCQQSEALLCGCWCLIDATDFLRPPCPEPALYLQLFVHRSRLAISKTGTAAL